MVGQQAEAIDDPTKFLSRETRDEARTQQDRLILKDERDGHDNPNIPGTDSPEDLKAGTTIRSEAGDKD